MGRAMALYRSLRELSDRHDRNYPQPCATEPGHGTIHPPSKQFARLVQDRLERGVLRYSDRLNLFDAAQSMAIGRFQANLIIAAVQHRAEDSAPGSPSPVRPKWLMPVTIVLLVQLLIFAAAWGLFAR